MIPCTAISDTNDVDAHLLRTFVTVARLGSFSAAAAELQYTQAAVSQQIAALEADLKVQLLRRRPVEPTEAGTRLLEHAVPILLRLDAARADVIRMTAPPAARLMLAMTPVAAVISPALGTLAELRARMPRLGVTVRVTSRQEVAEATARGDADLGLTDGLAAPTDPLPPLAPLSAVGVAEAVVAVIVPAGHPLASRGVEGGSPPLGDRRVGLHLSDLADARWIDAPGVAPGLADLRRAAGTEGFRPALCYHGTDIAALLRLAAEGHGLTIMPSCLLSGAPLPAEVPGVTAVAICAPRLVYRVELIHGTLPAGTPAAVLAALLST
jgi:DNA-binding transcriptional LysR family regulator